MEYIAILDAHLVWRQYFWKLAGSVVAYIIFIHPLKQALEELLPVRNVALSLDDLYKTLLSQ
jgi:hypothetical protein